MDERKLIELAGNLIGEENFTDEMKEITKEIMNKDQYIPQGNTGIFDPEDYYLDVSLIRVRLKECKLTLKQLHEQVGVSYRTVTRWLSKDEFPKHKNLMSLAEALQIEPHELVVRKSYFSASPLKDELRFVHRHLEKLVVQILNDEKTPKDKKLDALIKFHSTLLKAKKSSK
jgi:transcriptional regulator with XRE-family HTH domain